MIRLSDIAAFLAASVIGFIVGTAILEQEPSQGRRLAIDARTCLELDLRAVAVEDDADRLVIVCRRKEAQR